MRKYWTIVSVAALTFVVVFLSGCGTGNTNFTPTRGQVFTGTGTQPAEGAQVALVPIEGKDDPAARPTGVVGPDGTFTLSTYDPATRETHEGAPPGKYTVLVTWYPRAGLGELDHDAPKAVDRLRGRYKDPSTSPYRVEILAERTELDPIRISEPAPVVATGKPFG